MNAGQPVRIVRGMFRLAALALVLLTTRVQAVFLRRADLRWRCRWRQRWSRRLLWLWRLPVACNGTVPDRGLIVSNHLTYLDVLVYGAIFNGVIVSKSEVRCWPVIGPSVAAAGTIFVDRSNARSAAEATRAIARALAQGVPVLVFPEGTTSAGETVLPFQSPVFEAAVRTGAPLWAAALHYETTTNQPDDLASIPYWGNMVFFPHVMRVLRLQGLRAFVRFDGVGRYAEDRRVAAAEMRSAVQALHRLPATARIGEEEKLLIQAEC